MKGQVFLGAYPGHIPTLWDVSMYIIMWRCPEALWTWEHCRESEFESEEAIDHDGVQRADVLSIFLHEQLQLVPYSQDYEMISNVSLLIRSCPIESLPISSACKSNVYSTKCSGHDDITATACKETMLSIPTRDKIVQHLYQSNFEWKSHISSTYS